MIALGLALASCTTTRKCKGGTMLLTVTLAGPALAADNIEVAVDVSSGAPSGGDGGASDGGAPLDGRFTLPGSTKPGTVEIDFPSGYPTGQMVGVRVTAFKGGARITSNRVSTIAAPTCSTLAITVGGGDGGTSCDPAVDTRCSDDQMSLLTCRPDGSGIDTSACEFGCGAPNGTPHCLHLDPSGVVSTGDVASGMQSVTVSADATLNTDTGEITGGITRPAGAGNQGGITFRAEQQPGSTVSVGVFGFAGLALMQGATLHFTGKSPVALVSSADVTIAGNLDGQGDCMTPVAGGAAGGTAAVNSGIGLGPRGGGAGVGNADQASGGGGGGYGDAGGRGGNGTGGAGGTGGAPFGTLTMEPLLFLGGSGGGVGGNSGGQGGNGGGAIQLAVDGTLTVSGTINAGGCGGQAGAAQTGGGGGGAGGALLFEAGTIHLTNTAQIAVNGGGGGGAAGGKSGTSGAPTTTNPPGGAGAGDGTAGGAGGAMAKPAGTRGVDVTGTLKNGGGGGGGAGRIAFKSQSGMLTDDGALVSPARSDTNQAGQAIVTVGRATFQ